ncbi:hypothetical protein H8S75_23985 [Hungatella sp. L12]|uniref:Phage tail protein n=1 Tax=Hungatella hominis TaxID=2763050 RepID=A0ABR7HCZ7_9FIRM|nr:hypothetical protein [Hungatella hominis]MBC5711002.1 hypothetical protein [Hungatella hominis]
MNKKFYQVEKEINGTKYIAQFSGISAALRAADSSHMEGSEAISAEKYGQYILEHIIVEPKGLTADDFDSLEDYNAVTSWGRDVMQGKFRNEAETAGSTAKGK